MVMKHCFKVGIPWRGLMHDLSKYSPTELKSGIKYYQGNRSPNEKEREVLGYSTAWLHHKGRNKHHFEYWYDVKKESNRYEPVEIPIVYLAEMFCDRVAASKIYKGDSYRDNMPLEYFLTVKARDKMHPETSKTLERWLTILANEGEDVAFKTVKEEVKAAKRKKN